MTVRQYCTVVQVRKVWPPDFSWFVVYVDRVLFAFVNGPNGVPSVLSCPIRVLTGKPFRSIMFTLTSIQRYKSESKFKGVYSSYRYWKIRTHWISIVVGINGTWGCAGRLLSSKHRCIKPWQTQFFHFFSLYKRRYPSARPTKLICSVTYLTQTWWYASLVTTFWV